VSLPTHGSFLEEVQRNFAGAAEYARLYEASSSCSQFFSERLRIVTEIIGNRSNGRVLDVGCGPGILLSRLAASGLKLCGVDCSPEMIIEAKRRTRGTDVKLMIGRAEALPFKDRTFDVVLALGMLEYLPDVMKGLTEIARVTKPNAVIVLSMLNADSVYRSWERLVYSPSNDSWLQRQLGKNEKSLLHLHRKKSLSNMMNACHLDTVNVTYFDANVCLPPLDTEYPRKTKKLNNWIVTHSAPWSYSLLHTAFILTARKRKTLARAA
jgi:ubiquinone/menaquinone biosynthesis C-methylase UbiE